MKLIVYLIQLYSLPYIILYRLYELTLNVIIHYSEQKFHPQIDPVDCMSNPQWLKICQHCRLLKCRQVGMRDEYVHNLRIQDNGIR